MPPAVSSAGLEAVELAASAGLHLDRWQSELLVGALGERADGRWAAFEVGLVVGRQNGKGSVLEARELAGIFLFGEELILHSAHEFKDLDVDTPILTTTGWSDMGGVEVGDEVFAPDGQPTKVVAAHDVLRDSDCYRVTFADGQSLVAGAGHLWDVTEVARSGGRCRRVVSTTAILEAGLVHQWDRPKSRVRRIYRWRVDLPSPIENPTRVFPVDPYLLGIWLGDGDKRGGRITSGAADLPALLGELDRLGEIYTVAADKRTDGRVFCVRVLGLTVRLKALGVLGAKRIPPVYLLGSVQQRRDLLAGVMDSDGTVSGHQLAVTMINQRLMGDIACLVRSLGYRATERTFRASLNGVDAGPMYRVQFAPSSISPFRLARKSTVIKRLRTSRSAYNAIVAVERVPTRPTRCITVAHESGCYLVGHGFIPTHNTASEAFRRLLNLITNCDDLAKRVARVRTSHGDEGIELLGGQRIRFVARSTGSGRGFSGDLVVLDEAYNLPGASISALLPTMAARPNPQLWYASSAPLPRVESDTLRRLCRRGRDESESRFAFFEWCADRDLPRDDPGNWALANPALGVRISEEFIRSELAALDPEDFDRERLGLYPEQIDAVDPAVPEEDWAGCEDRGSRLLDPVVLALEVSVDRRWGVIAAAGRSSVDGMLHVELVEHRRYTGWMVGRLAELVAKHNPAAVVVYPSGPAGALVADCEKEQVELTKAGGADVARACGAAFDEIVGRRWRHIGQPVLTLAVNGSAKRSTGDTWVFDRRGAADISAFSAVILAAWGARTAVVEAAPNVW